MKDAKFVADAKKTGISVNPLTGSEIETLLKRVYATDRAIVEMLKKAIPKMG